MIGDADAVRALKQVSDLSRPHSILHYFYLSDPASADALSEVLIMKGFQTEVAPSGYDDTTAVLARHVVVPSETHMAELRVSMEALVRPFFGEYDGWEAEVNEDSALH